MGAKIDNSMRGMVGRSAAGVLAVATGSYGNSQALHAPVLVLNASYEPINVCAARRAIVLVLKGVAMAEEENGHFLHAARVAMRVPSVIRLLEYRRIPHQTRALSRKNILLRDRNTCQRRQRFAGGDKRINFIGLGVGAFGRKSEIGVEGGILRVDSGEEVGGEFARGEFFGGEGGFYRRDCPVV